MRQKSFQYLLTYLTDYNVGYTTPAINANFGPAALKYVLESIPGMGTVTVEMSTFSASGEARVCGYNYLSTTYITLNNYVGINPPRMRLITGKTVNSRLNAAGELPIVGESLTLYMQTTYTLTCPACAGCNAGVIWFSMGDSISDEILLIAEYDSVSTAISRAIRNLEDLKRGNWENLEVVVTASSDDSRICLNGQSNLFTVNVRSNYGNLPKIDMIGSAWKGERNEVALTWISVIFQEGTPLPCSGQGFCNYTAGRCECSRFYDQNKIQFEMISSDGAGNAGNRGDCGHYKRTRSSLLGAACTSTTNSTNGGKTLCSGHGECLSMLSDACSCYTGWSGILCNIATTCPSGPAWFDEAISSTVAHQPAVCSNMGLCNRKSGRCACRKGYYGAACQYKDCPRNESGVACNGQGWCMSMHKWAEIAGFEYGDEQNALVAPAAWDAFGFHACMCSAGHPSPYSRSGRSNTMRPEVGPMSMIDGWPAQTPKLPGWRGYSCQERNCPSGNRIVSPSTDSSATAVFEEQIVGCIGGNTSNVSFTLSFYDHNTATITGEMGPSEIKAAIEWAPTIGNVSISFLDGTLQTACSRFNSAFDGFVVRFDTELGNIPLLQLVDSKNAMVNISQRVAGTLVRNLWLI